MGLALQAGATHKKEEGDLEGSALYRKEEEWSGLPVRIRIHQKPSCEIHDVLLSHSPDLSLITTPARI